MEKYTIPFPPFVSPMAQTIEYHPVDTPPVLVHGQEPWWSGFYYWTAQQLQTCDTAPLGWFTWMWCQLVYLVSRATPLCILRWCLWLLFLWATYNLGNLVHSRVVKGESFLGSYHSFVSRKGKQS